MRGSIVETDDLIAITGAETPEAAARAMRKDGIKVFGKRSKPYTTIELINAAGGILSKPANNGNYEPDDVL